MIRVVKNNVPLLLMLGALSLCGLFHDFLAALFSVALLVYLLVTAMKQKALSLFLNPVTVLALALPVVYLLCSLWAVDSGMAVLGFVKLLPAPLFLLAFRQEIGCKERLLDVLPHYAAVTTALTAVLMQFPPLDNYFAVAGRLAGFFQYSNTYALFVLMSLICLITKPILKRYDYLCAAVLIGGILYSGSRTVMLLTGVCVVLLVLFVPGGRTKLIFGGLFVAMLVVAVVYAVVTNRFDDIGRFLRLSLSESTFLGRLLYYKDALGVIATHPFGLGYMGYHLSQQSFQTGFYAVQYVHNDLLQLLLDVGWIPAAGAVFVIGRAFFKKGASLRRRLLMFVTVAHACFDFDLQFPAMLALFLLVLEEDAGKPVTLKPHTLLSPAPIAAVLAVVTLYFGTAQVLTYGGKHEAALTLYPYHTSAQIKLMTAQTKIADAAAIADDILARNEYVAVAYSAKARLAYSQGRFQEVVNYKQKVFTYAPYQIDDYNEFCQMLVVGIQLYEQHGDKNSADYCRRQLLAVPGRLKRVEANTDPLAFRLKDKPPLTLGSEWTQVIAEMEATS